MGTSVGEGMGGFFVGGKGDAVEVGPSLSGVRLGDGERVGWIVV
jgi:hypothetical protein